MFKKEEKSRRDIENSFSGHNLRLKLSFLRQGKEAPKMTRKLLFKRPHLIVREFRAMTLEMIPVDVDLRFSARR